MPKRGGKRPGAGRKPGVPNKMTQTLRERILARGPSPLEILADMYLAPRPEREDNESLALYLKRLELWSAEKKFAADKAAPYLHSRLSSIEITGEDGGPIKHQHRVEVEFVTPARKK